MYFEYFAVLKLEGSGCRVGRRVRREENQEPFYQNIDLTAVLFKHTDKHTHTHQAKYTSFPQSASFTCFFCNPFVNFVIQTTNFADFPAFIAGFSHLLNQNYFRQSVLMLTGHNPSLGSCESEIWSERFRRYNVY